MSETLSKRCFDNYQTHIPALSTPLAEVAQYPDTFAHSPLDNMHLWATRLLFLLSLLCCGQVERLSITLTLTLVIAILLHSLLQILVASDFRLPHLLSIQLGLPRSFGVHCP